MWPFRKNNRRRCVETRKVSSGDASLWRRFIKSGGLGAAGLAAGFYVCLLILSLWPANPLPYKPGQYIHSGISARVPFAITNRQQLEKLQSLINEQSTFVPNSTLIDKIVASVQSLPESLKAATQPENASEDIRTRFGLDEPTLAAWREFAAPEKQDEFAAQIAAMRNELTKTVIVSAAEAQDQRTRLQSFDAKFIVAEGGIMQPRPIRDMIATDETTRITQACEEIAKKFKSPTLSTTQSSAIHTSVQKYLLSVLAPPAGKGAASVAEATYTKDAALTKINREQALAALAAAPPQTQYAEGDLLVQGSHLTGKNRDAFLKADNIALIEQEHATYVQNQRNTRPILYYGEIVGRATVLLLVVVLLCVYIARVRPEMVENYACLIGLAGVFITMAILIKLISGFVGWNGQVTTVLPILLSAVILSIVFDQRFAWTSSVVFSLLMVLQLRAGLDMFVVFIVATTATIFQLREIRTRTKLPIVAAITAGVVFVTIASCGMVQAYPWRIVGYQGLLAGGAAFLLCLTQVMLPVIERIFGVATSMTLLEFADASKPVLRRLALEAPGTYNHSLQLGTLCEAAAETVGANGLLARVGAYYHDIGKINKPDYFVENQAGSPSKHQKLSPAMSLL
ncbi:MAG: HDIG domain-containing protein, partial [Planctomycetaceae bacterium]